MNAKPLIAIGYWHYPYLKDIGCRFPVPQTLVRANWIESEKRAIVLRYLRSASKFEGYRGLSWCRFRCGVSDYVMGNLEYWDGVWAWPQGLAHYVEFHDVILPDDFVQHALSHLGVKLPDSPTAYELNFDYWIEWSSVESARKSAET